MGQHGEIQEVPHNGCNHISHIFRSGAPFAAVSKMLTRICTSFHSSLSICYRWARFTRRALASESLPSWEQLTAEENTAELVKSTLGPMFKDLVSLVRGILARIRKQMESMPLPRGPLKGALLELEQTLERVKIRGALFLTVVLKTIPSTYTDPATGRTFHSFQIIEFFGKFIDSEKKKAQKISELLDARAKDDDEIRLALEKFLRPKEQLMTWLQELAFHGMSGSELISELVGMGPAGLGENWAAAVCYLSSMEVVVNRKFTEMDLKIDPKEKKSFRKRFAKLFDALKKQGFEVSELDMLLKDAFWELRARVVHSGYSPTNEELEQIIKWVKRVLTIETFGKGTGSQER